MLASAAVGPPEVANGRIVRRRQIEFEWKDYRRGARAKSMTLAATEFIRRFLLHVLPTGFQRIRGYGLLGNRHRTEKLTRCRHLLGMPPVSAPTTDTVPDHRDRVEALTGISLRTRPICQESHLIAIAVGASAWTSPAVLNTS